MALSYGHEAIRGVDKGSGHHDCGDHQQCAGGTKRVVASLWNVPGEATAELMGRFYREMMAGKAPPAQALKAAQASMWADARWASPINWAAFVLQGEWRDFDRFPYRTNGENIGTTVLSRIYEDVHKPTLYRLKREDVKGEPWELVSSEGPVAKYLAQRLIVAELTAQAQPRSAENDARMFLDLLHQEIETSDLYVPQWFEGVELSAEVQALLRNRSPSDRMRLNRLLLSEVFPTVLRSPITASKEIAPNFTPEKYSWFDGKYCLVEVHERDRRSVLSRLDLLTKVPLYGCSTEPSSFLVRQVTGRCNFVRSIAVPDSAVEGYIDFVPSSWRRLLATERLRKVWLEGNIRVDSQGRPLSETGAATRPVAVVTDKSIYLIAEDPFEDRRGFGGSAGVQLQGQVFELAKRSDLREAVDKLMTAYLRELHSAFQKPPYNARPISERLVIHGEDLMRSSGQMSQILNEKQQEAATYLLNWWAADNDSVTFSRLMCGKGQVKCSGHKIFIQNELALYTRRVASQPYRPASTLSACEHPRQSDVSGDSRQDSATNS